MKVIFLLLGVGLLGGVASVSHSPSEAQRVEIAFCQFLLSDDLKQSNTSFTVSYSFRVDENGRPIDIKRVLGKDLFDDQAASCLSEWKFSGITSRSLLVAAFRWEHGIGWSDLTVTGTGFNQIIKLKGERCPYK